MTVRNDPPQELRISADEFRTQIPPELLDNQRTKGKAPVSQGFAYRLWHLLKWASNDPMRMNNLGARWTSPNEFALDKSRYAEVIKSQPNTINFKLRSCKFNQSQPRTSTYTFWKCEGFTAQSTENDLIAIDNKRDSSEASPQFTDEALHIPLLETVRIYPPIPENNNRFKNEAIFLWEEIVPNHCIWAYSLTQFIEAATMKFCASYSKSSSGETFTYDAQQTQFSQYLKNYNLDLHDTARKMLTYVLTHKNTYCITIPEFCTFFARFGPDDSVLEKIHQLLCCSKAYNDWFKPVEQTFDLHKPITGCYSNTFANCFIIKRSQGITFHVYNQPFFQGPVGFLFDESDKNFNTWHAVFEMMSCQQIQYQANPADMDISVFNYQNIV
ncbi:hypothetical protein TVAG_118770 [Trichomonas vaginalis G3]|uniref:Initiator binding domain-containing protein n=1 Tax=Trichomonas vaginalis (strain ATCC PRA-98 / G3) TaxID=412133 RepID=A2EAY0_TRIV3|nr:Initiator binding protein 39 kDa family [Trichomonas vaginalis G3]EAY10225.1 hypothetical protein TVAG_118770 [Trichomonas vaginalis G3]KAI5514013.1 Initiator binding protein 39 kDa family [Trichomonas vaginalis G3]|eukprot:XP_001322448.1 hypothetical protein [Trichomonas vaginalis G3]